MKRTVLLLIILLTSLIVVDSDARRDALTPKQKERLAKADLILLEVIALTDRGQVDAGAIKEVVSRRMAELEYTIVPERKDPHDVVFKVKCEQRKVWEGTIASGGDADLPDSPSRVWKGPACQLTYLLRGRNMGWRKEVRTDFQDSIKAAGEAKVDEAGAYALAELKVKLEHYDFPVLVTADWGQVPRLLRILDDLKTSETRKIKIISVLGEIFAVQAVPRLSEAVKDPNVEIAREATLALGNIGQQDTIPLLEELIRSGRPQLRPAAVKALGQVGALNYDYSVVEPLVEALKSDDLRVKTEAAWALGRLPDRRSYQPLYELHEALHTGHGSKVDPQVAELRKAVFWSLKQVEPSDQIN